MIAGWPDYVCRSLHLAQGFQEKAIVNLVEQYLTQE